MCTIDSSAAPACVYKLSSEHHMPTILFHLLHVHCADDVWDKNWSNSFYSTCKCSMRTWTIFGKGDFGRLDQFLAQIKFFMTSLLCILYYANFKMLT